MKKTIEIDKRENLQLLAHSQWIREGKTGTIEIATGLGKTFIGLRALHSMPKDDDKVHYYLAETITRRKDLFDAIEKYDKKYNTNTFKDYNLNFHCYQEVRNWRGVENIGLVIADEIHDSLTPENIKFYKYNNYDAIIGLSAKVNQTIEYKEVRGVLKYTITKGNYLKRYCPIVFSYTMQEARKDNLNRDLTVHIIQHDLNYEIKNIKQGSSKKAFYTTELKAYLFWKNKYKEAAKIKDYKLRNIKQQIALSNKNKILYGLPSKIKATRELLKYVDRCIIFGNSVDALLKVTPYVITSRNSEHKNNYFRKRFDNGLIDNIASFKKLKQGANLVNLQNMIMMSYYSIEGDIIQRFGRLRKNKDEKGNVFIFVTNGTEEEQWYATMLNEIKDTYKIKKHLSLTRCIDYLKFKNELKSENKN